MFNDFHCGVTDLVCRQKLMELGKVTVSLENVQQVQRQIYAFFVIVSECARYCAKQCFMF